MHISYVWIVVAALVQWLLGALWYGVIFKKSWRKLVGLPESEKPKNAIFALAVALVACLLLSFVLAHVVEMAGAALFTKGFMLGVVCWLGFMAPPLFAQHIFEGRRANLFAINAAYWLLAMALGGAILAAFH
jgi:MFS family permease